MRLYSTFVILVCSATSWCQGVNDTVGAPGATVSATGVRVVQKLGSQLPVSARFKDQYGRDVRLGQLLTTRPAVLLPIFYRCQGVCEIETENLLAGLARINLAPSKDFDVIVLSIDPVEGPDLALAKMKSSLATSPNFKGTEAGWHFLSGSLDQIRSVTDALGFFYTYDQKDDIVNHPSGVMFITPQARVSSYILNPNFTKEQLEGNLGLAAKNTIGEKTADSFLGCVHTDPITGQKSINILRFLSLFALVFLIGVVALIAFLNKSSKRISANRGWNLGEQSKE